MLNSYVINFNLIYSIKNKSSFPYLIQIIVLNTLNDSNHL